MFNFGINDKKVHFKMTGSDKRNSRKKGAFRLNFTNSNQAKSYERNVDSPLFGNMTVPDQSKFLGMSTKMKMKFYVMIIAILGLALLIGDNLLTTLAEINEANKKANDTTDQKLIEEFYKERRDDTFMYTNMRTVKEDAKDVNGMQLPSYKPLDNEENIDTATDSDETQTEPDTESESKKDVEDKNEVQDTKVPEIDDSEVPLDENGYKPKVTLPVGVYESIDYLEEENPRLHAELLLKMNSLTEEQIKKLSNPFRQIKVEGDDIDTWYKTYKTSKKLKNYTGKVFELEATIFKLEKKKIEYFNLKSENMNEITEVWTGILAFRYLKSYPIGNKQEEKLQDEMGYVSFTALELPEWLTPERVYDEKQLPLRGKFYGAFYGVPNVNVSVIEKNSKDTFPMSHIVLGIAEQTDSIQPGFDKEMIHRIYDGNNYAMRNVPLLALLNMLYTIKFTPEEKINELMKQVDTSIGYFDLLNNPPVMRKVSPIVRFTGELGKMISEREPFKQYTDIKPNPYNMRKFKLGALRITKFEKPEILLFDANEVEIINPHTGKYVPEGTSVCPETGKKIDNPYLNSGDYVEVFGYMLFNWDYSSQEGKFITAPRIVAFKVRQLPTKEEDTSYLNWIFLAVVIIVIVVVIILVRKEKTKAQEFRSQFYRSHMQKPAAGNLKLNKPQKAEEIIGKTEDIAKNTEENKKSDSKSEEPENDEKSDSDS